MASEVREIICYNILQVCSLKGIKSTIMLENAGVDKSLLSDMRNRHRTPSIEAIQKVAAYLGVSVDNLLDPDFEYRKPPADKRVVPLLSLSNAMYALSVAISNGCKDCVGDLNENLDDSFIEVLEGQLGELQFSLQECMKMLYGSDSQT